MKKYNVENLSARSSLCDMVTIFPFSTKTHHANLLVVLVGAAATQCDKEDKNHLVEEEKCGGERKKAGATCVTHTSCQSSAQVS